MKNHNEKNSESQDKPLLAAALTYAERGLHVFPVYEITSKGLCSCPKGPKCEHPGKHPRFHPKDLNKGHRSATVNQDLIYLWWRRWPKANIGIATGKISGIVVLDIDPRNGGDVDKLPGEVPPTPTVLTGGGGLHFYFKYPENKKIGCAPDLLPGVDVKGDGGYVVAPPSNHIAGGSYTWEPPGGLS